MVGNIPLPGANSKTNRIIALLQAGNSDEEITQLENTTKEFVRKVRCNLKKGYAYGNKGQRNVPMPPNTKYSLGGGLPKNSQVSEQTIVAERSDSLRMPALSGRNALGPQLSKIPQLTEDQRKDLWGDFRKGKTPIECVIKYGYHHYIVLSEYDAYLEFENIELTRGQPLVVQWLSSHELALKNEQPNEHAEFKKIVSDYYSKKRYLTKEQHTRLFDICLQLSEKIGVESVGRRTDRTPRGWVRPPCNICHEPVIGVITKSDGTIGKGVLQYLESRTVHSSCDKAKRELEDMGT